MKNLLFVLFAFIAFTTTNTFAQTCQHGAKKTCSHSSGTASVNQDDAYFVAATNAAAQDPTIEKRECAKAGTFCFYRNSKDAEGNVSSTEVMYDQASATFINATSKSNKGCCASKKACCAKGSKSCSKDKEAKSENKIMN